ncbi:hypothetical protein M404DRAFT_370803 [Pisolithus tinctorius Marx 270]|uniref:Uncharacterized protein n=1 Tax=Pisolithus tinctorius Marx 270 TaxID=870435 RepID=A0A0C3JAT0_PISTI|nr:hypothetical protein M404DRAFT_370803 [Pisolithus tinctorius Marx 270]
MRYVRMAESRLQRALFSSMLQSSRLLTTLEGVTLFRPSHHLVEESAPVLACIFITQACQHGSQLILGGSTTKVDVLTFSGSILSKFRISCWVTRSSGSPRGG